MPFLYIIGGPNGAGKTTAAFNLLPDTFETIEFVNADEIARGLSPLNPESVSFHAGRIMLERFEELINAKKSFAFESTLSGTTYKNLLRKAQDHNYTIVLFFIYLNSAELAKERVSIRVNKGGHNIPDNVIYRRYLKGIKNFSFYSSLANSWYIYDNSGAGYVIVAKNIEGQEEIYNFDVYSKIVADEK